MDNGDQFGDLRPDGSRGAGPYRVMHAVANQYGSLPPFDTGFGPAFGRGWGTWGGQWTTPSTGAADLTDDQIESLIYDALDNDPVVPHNADVDVTVEGGTVTLSGDVRGKQAKRHIGRIAWTAPGVRDVHNHIAIRSRRSSGAATAGQSAAASKSSTPTSSTRSRPATKSTGSGKSGSSETAPGSTAGTGKPAAGSAGK
ncbi:MAG TPA: BON domain-containing protein [Chloroflexota bacterium]|nr:BON domain-containing protein [Chloroflexota bacterium]